MGDRAGVVPQLLGAAVGIVLGATLLFALLGMLRGDDPTPEVVADPSPTATATPSDDATVGPDDQATPAPTEDPSPTPTEEPTTAPTEEPTETPTEEPPAATVDPASISIQVLDAIGGGDGGAAAQAVADELETDGFDVIVVNLAGRTYEVTTVFWSAGQEVEGRQVASALGTSEAEQTPVEVQLSDSVDVHVVVGADRT